ncbi:MAG: kynurenine formamidase [Candidatus Hydrogenedentota bacterium]
MGLVWHDVSIPIREGMTVWPGDVPYSIAPSSRIDNGASTNVSAITLSTHCGSHVDAPWHFENDGARLDQVPKNLFFGEAAVIDCTGKVIVTAEDLGKANLPPRILIKTDNSSFPSDPFRTDYVALDPDAAQRMVDEGVRLVGVDALSVAPYKQPGQPTHHILLQNNVLIVEGLRLMGVPAGDCWFTVLPLPLEGADGAPCRAFIGWEDLHA